MFRRNGRVLAMTSAVLCLVALAGGPAAISLLGQVPEETDIDWAYPWAHDATPPAEGERIARVENAARELEQATAVRWLASPASMAELRDAEAAFDASMSPLQGSPSSPEQRLALAIHDVRNSARGTPVVASIVFVVVGLGGLLGFLRLRRFAAATLAACSLLTLGATGGIAALSLLDVNPAWAVTPTLLCVLGFFGVLIGATLLPDSNHPLVVAVEERLRRVPARRRRVHVAIRVAGGLALSVVAVAGTVVSHAVTVPGAYYTAYVGTFAVGLVVASVPLIAAIRLSADEPPRPSQF